jgi:hypothetical protein
MEQREGCRRTCATALLPPTPSRDCKPSVPFSPPPLCAHPHASLFTLLSWGLGLPFFFWPDHITFRLGNGGYHALKVVPYGPIRVVLPYIIRRAQENSSVLGRVAEERSKVTKALVKRTLLSL